MGMLLPREYTVPEDSFLWKNPATKYHPPLLDTQSNDDGAESKMPGMNNFTVFGIGSINFLIMQVETVPFYASILEAITMVSEREREHLLTFARHLKEELPKYGAKHALVYGAGQNGFNNMRILGYYQSGMAAEHEYYDVVGGLKRGDFTALHDEDEQLLHLEKGERLLISTSNLREQPDSPQGPY